MAIFGLIPYLEANYQPLSTSLTDVAALTVTSYGLGFLELADAAAARTYIAAISSVAWSDITGIPSPITAFSTYNTNGLITQTAANTYTGRTLTGTSNRITVSDGDGVSGNPTLDVGTNVVVTTGSYSDPSWITSLAYSRLSSVPSNLTTFAAYNTNGLFTQTASGTYTGRTITGTASQIVVTNGSGVSGNPTIDVGANVILSTGSYSNPAWITGLAWSKISSTPTTLSGYGITNAQPLDATLTALAAYNTNGVLTQTAADTFVGRTMTGTANRISITNGDGVSGNPTFDVGTNVIVSTGSYADPAWITSLAYTKLTSVPANLTALASYNTNGIFTQTASGTYTGRTLTGTANQVVITNGDGVSGNPTFTLPQSIATTSTPTFDSLTLNTLETISVSSLGTTQVTTKGALLVNPTAAANGAQQISPANYWKGNAWNATAAASQPVTLREYLLPVQGNPVTCQHLLQESRNGGTQTTRRTLTSTSIEYKSFSGTSLFKADSSTGFVTNGLTIITNSISDGLGGAFTSSSGTATISDSFGTIIFGDGAGNIDIGGGQVLVSQTDVQFAHKISSYNSIALAPTGNGFATVNAAGRQTSQTAAATLSTCSVTGESTFTVTANIRITTSSSFSFVARVTYTDEGNVGRTFDLVFFKNSGSATGIQTIDNTTGAGVYSAIPLTIRCITGSTITVATVGTFGSVTYNGEATCLQTS